MSIEARLRDSMRARVAAIEARELRPLPVRGRRVWPAVATGFAVVLVAVLAIGVFTSGDGSMSGPATSARYPSRIVAITRDGRLVVLSSKDGKVLRTIARDASTDGGLAVSPDGRFVYYTRVTGHGCSEPGRDELNAVVRVSLKGRRPEVIASQVRLPAISPDGRFLAFTGTSCSDAGGAILVKDLHPRSDKGNDRRWDGPRPGEITSLFWGPDSRHLAFESMIDGYPRILDAGTEVPLAGTPRVEIGDGTVWFGYLGDTGDFLAYRFGPPGRPAEIQAISADVTPRRLADAGSNVAPSALRSDASGRHILFVQANRVSRWEVGQTSLGPVAEGVSDAMWLPRS